MLAARSSDHAPLTVSFSHMKSRQCGRKSWFRYDASWHKNKETCEVIKQVWKVREPSGDSWRVVKRKLAKSRSDLVQWRRVNVSPIEETIKMKTVELHTLQGMEGLMDLEAIWEVQQEVNRALEQVDLK